MSKLDDLKEILLSVKSLEDDLNSSDETRANAAQKRYHKILNEFYADNEEMLAPQQYKIAKQDCEYFLRLITLAIAYCEVEEKTWKH